MVLKSEFNGLPELHDYSKDEIQKFSDFSSAGKIYFELLNSEGIEPIFKRRHEAWLRVALANFHNKSDQKARSFHWSKTMDSIVLEAFNKYFTNEDRVLVLALGKYGSEVLNLSSDIDIILIADAPITNDLLKKARNFVQFLNAKTPYGFLTRVDLNLKPTDQPGPIVTTNHLTNYLWNSSELWERLVYTRARKVCGQLEDEDSLLAEISKFCFRKYIRQDLVVGLAELLQKILENNFDDHNIKLCPGGIRSVELLLSAIQLLYAGRVKEFQSFNTYQILRSLDRIRIFNEIQIESLKKNYDILRAQEDRLQSELDEQTHSVEDISPLQQLMLQNQKNIEIFLATIASGKATQKSLLVERLKDLSLTYTHLSDFIKFLTKHPAYVALFETHPKSYDNLLRGLIHSPQVTRLVILRPDLMDMFLLKKAYFESEDTDEELLIKLSDFKSISQITAIGEFLTGYDLDKLLLKSSKTADFCVEKILSRIFKNEPVDILKLGKWSANELGVFSDLDFIFVYDGPNELSKNARKFISYLTHGTFHGPFYSIDLRLRPSGNAGPILTSTPKLKNYLDTYSPVWLRQAYLRNHFLKSNARFKFELKDLTIEEKKELIDIRSKRLTPLSPSKVHLKDNFGGIVDIEFFVQCLFLNARVIPEKDALADQIDELIASKLLAHDIAITLKQNYKVLRMLEQISEILFQSSQILENDFRRIIDLPNFIENAKHVSSFSNLTLMLQSTKDIIDEGHPFK